MSTEDSIYDPNKPATPRQGAGIVPPDLGRQVKQDAANLVDTARHEADAAGRELGGEFDQLKHEAGAQFESLKQEAEQRIGEGVEKAKGFASEQKDVLAGQLAGVANALDRVAGDLEGDQAVIGRYARDISSGMHRVANTIKSNDVDALMGQAEDFARRQQVAFLGLAGLAGILASRFLLASAHRRSQSSTRPGEMAAGDDGRPAAARPYASGSSYSSRPGYSSQDDSITGSAYDGRVE